jgi:hypothetical protein
VCSISHKAELSLGVGVLVRKMMSGLCEENRVVISVLEGMRRPVLFLFCVTRISSCIGVVGVGVI